MLGVGGGGGIGSGDGGASGLRANAQAALETVSNMGKVRSCITLLNEVFLPFEELREYLPIVFACCKKTLVGIPTAVCTLRKR